MRPLVIYHGNCADGFTSAWIAHHHFNGDLDLHAGVYQTPPPDVTGRFVILIDFSYKREVLQKMADDAKFILVLDHHKSAALDLHPDVMEDMYALHKSERWESIQHEISAATDGDIYALFDMNRSGASIAWDFFFPGRSVPMLVRHVEDRDLWKFEIPGTREIQAVIFSYPYTIENWDLLDDMIRGNWQAVYEQGQAIDRKHFKDIAELLQVTTRPMRFWVPQDDTYYVVPVANLPYTMVSDAGKALLACDCYGKPLPAEDVQFVGKSFAVCYYDGPKGRNFSFRSDGKFDVSLVAAHYGGGGHKDAAGCRVNYDQLAQFEL